MSCQLADVCHMVLSYGLKICQQIRLGAKLAGLTKCPSGGVKVQALLNVMVRFDRSFEFGVKLTAFVFHTFIISWKEKKKRTKLTAVLVGKTQSNISQPNATHTTRSTANLRMKI